MRSARRAEARARRIRTTALARIHQECAEVPARASVVGGAVVEAVASLVEEETG